MKHYNLIELSVCQSFLIIYNFKKILNLFKDQLHVLSRFSTFPKGIALKRTKSVDVIRMKPLSQEKDFTNLSSYL